MAPVNDLSGKRILDIKPCNEWVAFLEQEQAIMKNNRRIAEKRNKQPKSPGSGGENRQDAKRSQYRQSSGREQQPAEPRRRTTKYGPKDAGRQPFPVGPSGTDVATPA